MSAFTPDIASQPDPLALEAVERSLATRRRGLRFEPALEARYQTDTHAQRRQFLTATGIAGALVYDLFLISDWLNLNDTFGLLMAGRLLLVTPVMIALLLIIQRLKSRDHGRAGGSRYGIRFADTPADHDS